MPQKTSVIKRIFLPAVFVLGLFFSNLLLFTPTPAYGLSDPEQEACFKEWNGDILSGERLTQFLASKCYVGNDGNCDITDDGGGRAQVDCTLPAPPPPPGSDPTEGCVRTSFPLDGDTCIDQQDGGIETNPIFKLLLTVLNFLAIGIGIVAVFAIAFAGFLILSSDGNSEQVAKGGKMIWNTVIGVLMFILMYALVNFIVPGGLFG